MAFALLIDFGSTYTKLRAVDLEGAALVGSAQGPSTVATDVNVGLDAALARLEARMGRLPPFRHRLATSSAAGGLRMVTVGLVRELTAEAARQAALGAGAKLVGSFAYRLTRSDVQRIEDLRPDILLLCGGTDGGNSEVILHNAAALGASAIACPVVIAGNRETADEARAQLEGRGKLAVPTGNVMPELNVLDVEPARAAIRDVFMQRIVSAKGIDRARERLDAVLMPTPAAVLEGARLLADGVGGEGGLGPLLVVDPGGATTDVHSVCTGAPSEPGVLPYGLPEPYAKRTVEGDLGMRHNAATIAEAVGIEALAAEAGLEVKAASALLAGVCDDVERLPAEARERAFDRALCRVAVRLAVKRHAGRTEVVYTAQGPVRVQRGKDLAALGQVIGTGGAIVHADAPGAILAAALAEDADPASLRPRAPRLLLDRHYLVYAAGLLASVEPRCALELVRSELVPVDPEEAAHGARALA